MKSLFRVTRYLRPYRPLAFLTLFSAGMITLIDLLPPWLIKLTIDNVIKENNLSLLKWIIAGLVFAYLFKNLLTLLRIRLNNQLEQKVIYDIRDHVYRSLQRLSLSFFENRSTGEIMSRVNNDVNNVERIFIDGIESMTVAVFTLLGITTVLFYLNWRLAVLALIPIPLLVLSAFKFTKQIHRLYHNIREKSAVLNSRIQDSISGIRETLSFNAHDFEISRFNQASGEYCKESLKVSRLWSLYSPGMIFIGSLGTLVVFGFGTTQVTQGSMTIGELIAFLSYLALFYVPINQIHSVNHMLQHALASGERVFEIIDQKPEIVNSAYPVIPESKPKGHIQFNQVSFYYRPEVPVIQEISFEAFPGEKIALVGPSGAGKSTLIKLLMRFYDVKRGSISIDGEDLRNFDLSYLRSQFGMVAQEPFLFNGTIRENIAYSLLNATDGEIKSAAIAARADEFIQTFPEKYDTWIGERGIKLSTGQKQRIAIARAILKNASIIILDEATSNIDTETELKIQEALEILTAQKTTFIIAHRLSTVRNASKILVIDHGQVVEHGSHADLLEKKGRYSSLYEHYLAPVIPQN
ncbi:MAG: ABC transporter ATP-binding protein [Nitrospirae bacterium]|nr:ABC transporter ATP-binding protein [Nitrospirota bacterium]